MRMILKATASERALAMYYLGRLIRHPYGAVRRKLVGFLTDDGRELFPESLFRNAPSAARTRRGELRSIFEPEYEIDTEAKLGFLLERLSKIAFPDKPPERDVRVRLAEAIADDFHLRDGVDRAIVGICVAGMCSLLVDHLFDVINVDLDGDTAPGNMAILLGRRPVVTDARLKPGAPLMEAGLMGFDCEDRTVRPTDTFRRLVAEPAAAMRSAKDVVLGRRERAALGRSDFLHYASDFDNLARLLDKAMAARATGVNVLLHGPQGTGKTEMAKALCAHIGADLYSVSESTTDTDADNRISELAMARTLVADEERTLLMVDEAEDVFLDERLERAGRRHGKLFLNRLLERNKTPVIWIVNDLGLMDPSVIRRFCWAVEMKAPPPGVRAELWRKALKRSRLRVSEAEIGDLAKDYELPPSFMAGAVKAAKLMGDPGALRRSLDGMDRALTGRIRRPKGNAEIPFEPAISNADTDLAALAEMARRAVGNGTPRFSLCLYGPPGTGKSLFARHLARTLGFEVLCRRGSDLLDPYLGGTERNIAEAFREAAADGKFLLFDEADGLLRDRRGAERHWEVTAVNEMLTWMESHPMPFACSTNLFGTLDRASLRRFTFKIGFRLMGPVQARAAFRLFFGRDAEVPVSGLAPGDFATVAAKASILGIDEPARLVAMLRAEARSKGLKGGPAGFWTTDGPLVREPGGWEE